MLAFLLISVTVRNLGPVQSDFFEVVKQRSDLFLYVGLKDGDIYDVNSSERISLKR